MRRFMVLSVATVVAVLASIVSAEACCLRGGCGCHSHVCCDSGCNHGCCGYSCGAAGCCGHNGCVTEKRIINVVEYDLVPKVRQVKVCRPKWVDDTRMVTVCEPVVTPDKVTYKKPVWGWVDVSGTNTVYRCRPVEHKHTITVNTGHWDTQLVEVDCDRCGCHGHCGSGCHNGCGGCGCQGHCGCDNGCGCKRTVCRRVWVPGTDEQRDVTYTRCEMVPEQVPYQARVCQCSWQDVTVDVNRYSTRLVQKPVPVKVLRCVEETVDQTYYERVARPAEQRTIEVPVHCGHCGHCGHCRGGCGCCN